MLTALQHQCLLFLDAEIKRTRGVAPSFEEMRIAAGLKSKSGIHRLVKALEERGFIRRLPQRARSIEVLRLPGDIAPFAMAGRLQPSPIPLRGRIASATPLFAITGAIGWVNVSPFVADFALDMAGDSMVEAGIHHGDRVLFEETPGAASGDIVVATIDREEATIARIRARGQSIALEKANPSYETRIFGASRIRIMGRLVGLIRKFPDQQNTEQAA